MNLLIAYRVGNILQTSLLLMMTHYQVRKRKRKMKASQIVPVTRMRVKKVAANSRGQDHSINPLKKNSRSIYKPQRE